MTMVPDLTPADEEVKKDGRSCRSRPARTSGISEITPENEESRYPVSRISAFIEKKKILLCEKVYFLLTIISILVSCEKSVFII